MSFKHGSNADGAIQSLTQVSLNFGRVIENETVKEVEKVVVQDVVMPVEKVVIQDKTVEVQKVFCLCLLLVDNKVKAELTWMERTPSTSW